MRSDRKTCIGFARVWIEISCRSDALTGLNEGMRVKGSHAVSLSVDQKVCYIDQYWISVSSKPTKQKDWMTIKPYPFIDNLSPDTSFVASFLSDPVWLVDGGDE